MMKKDTSPRATFMTINTETLEVATAVAPRTSTFPQASSRADTGGPMKHPKGSAGAGGAGRGAAAFWRPCRSVAAGRPPRRLRAAGSRSAAPYFEGNLDCGRETHWDRLHRRRNKEQALRGVNRNLEGSISFADRRAARHRNPRWSSPPYLPGTTETRGDAQREAQDRVAATGGPPLLGSTDWHSSGHLSRGARSAPRRSPRPTSKKMYLERLKTLGALTLNSVVTGCH